MLRATARVPEVQLLDRLPPRPPGSPADVDIEGVVSEVRLDEAIARIAEGVGVDPAEVGTEIRRRTVASSLPLNDVIARLMLDIAAGSWPRVSRPHPGHVQASRSRRDDEWTRARLRFLEEG